MQYSICGADDIVNQKKKNLRYFSVETKSGIAVKSWALGPLYSKKTCKCESANTYLVVAALTPSERDCSTVVTITAYNLSPKFSYPFFPNRTALQWPWSFWEKCGLVHLTVVYWRPTDTSNTFVDLKWRTYSASFGDDVRVVGTTTCAWPCICPCKTDPDVRVSCIAAS